MLKSFCVLSGSRHFCDMNKFYKRKINPVDRSETYRNQPVAGATFVLGASFIFAMVGTLVKVVSVSINNEMVVFFRNVCALIFILPWLAFRPPSGGIKTRL